MKINTTKTIYSYGNEISYFSDDKDWYLKSNQFYKLWHLLRNMVPRKNSCIKPDNQYVDYVFMKYGIIPTLLTSTAEEGY